jgi:hypothetical protein
MKQICLWAFAMLLLAACSKDDDKTSTPVPSVTLNEMEKKLVGTWKLDSSVTYLDESGSSTINTKQDCENDDVFVFANDKKYQFNEGGSSCGSHYTTTATTDIDWAVSSDSLFTFSHWPNYSGGVGGIRPQLTEISDTRFKLRQKYRGAFSNESVINTYIKQ